MNICRMNTSLSWRFFLACLLALLLAGCGFHLQGSLQMPEGVEGVHVAYNTGNYSANIPPLVKTLRKRLRAAGQLADANAGARLAIKRVRNSGHISAISPVDSSKAEYALRSEVVFGYYVNGQSLLENERLAVTRHYSYNTSARLAKDAERVDLQEDMQAELADRILFRIKQVSLASKK